MPGKVIVTGGSLGSSISTSEIDNNAVTFAKMQAVSADVLLGNDGSGTAVEEIACTAAGRALLDDAAASNQRTTLGLGTAAVEDVSAASADAGAQTVVAAMGGVDTVDRNTCAGLASTQAAIDAVQGAVDDLKAKLRTSGLLAT